MRRALSRTRRLWCISAAKSRDHCMYHGSSSAACSGGNITPFSGRTPWSTPAVSTRVGAAGDEVVAARELLDGWSGGVRDILNLRLRGRDGDVAGLSGVELPQEVLGGGGVF